MTEQEKLYKQLFDYGYECGIEDAQPKWISVKDRLPEEAKDVLVYTDKGEYAVDFYYISDFYYGENNVTHWMPLPKPPKGE